MTETKTFEDQFDHDPNAVYTDEEDIDLGPDDELADAPPKPVTPKRPDNQLPSGGGCLGGLFKIALSLGLIAFCYFYISAPEKFTTVQQKITELLAERTEELQSPSSVTDKPAAVDLPQATSLPQAVPGIILRGVGTLPDFSTATKNNPSLNSYLITADQLNFKTLDTYHDLLTKMITEWTGQTDPKKIEQITGLPYKQFFNQISVSLLSQTVLKQAGLTPSGTNKIIVQDPVQAMASVYPHLKEAMAEKQTVRDQLKTLEPVSSFLVHICRDGSECLASWDLLIDMLGAKQYAPILEKTPENIYRSAGE